MYAPNHEMEKKVCKEKGDISGSAVSISIICFKLSIMSPTPAMLNKHTAFQNLAPTLRLSHWMTSLEAVFFFFSTHAVVLHKTC